MHALVAVHLAVRSRKHAVKILEAVGAADRHIDGGAAILARHAERQPFPKAVLHLLYRTQLRVRQQDGELVASESSNNVVLSNNRLDPLRNLDKDLVAIVVAVGVIDS